VWVFLFILRKKDCGNFPQTEYTALSMGRAPSLLVTTFLVLDFLAAPIGVFVYSVCSVLFSFEKNLRNK
ncbi:hypothetical protein SFC57_19385, partial [Niallia circulans]|uniref:hypothetical protein n=1 Tax=Niallia circulans TaxID=1397 RepID=UPI003977ED68